MPLSVLRGERAPTDKWTEQDGHLAQSLTFFEASLCSGCGHPTWDTTGTENEGQWESDAFRCHACTATIALAEGLAEGSTKAKHLQAMRYSTQRRDPNEVKFWPKPSVRSPSS